MAVEFAGMKVDVRRPYDGRICVQDSPRPLGTIITFTSSGDNTSNPTLVGGGTFLKIDHALGDSTVQDLYVDFNIKENRTFIHEGYVLWKDANFDALSLGIVPTVTPTMAASNTFFNSYGGVIVPAAGNGTIQPLTTNLVEMPAGLDYGDAKPAYWDADYDSTNHAFLNVRANPYGRGQYNMFSSEVCLGTFVNNIMLLNQGQLLLETADTFELGHGMRLKMRIITNGGSDHAWKSSCIIALYRQKVAITAP